MSAPEGIEESPPDRAADYGVLSVHLVRAIENLPSVARCHTAHGGDGGARATIRDANAAFVIDRLIAAYGGEWING